MRLYPLIDHWYIFVKSAESGGRINFVKQRNLKMTVGVIRIIVRF